MRHDYSISSGRFGIIGAGRLLWPFGAHLGSLSSSQPLQPSTSSQLSSASALSITMVRVKNVNNVRFANSESRAFHFQRGVQRRTEYDSWGVPWGSLATLRLAGSTFVPRQGFFARCRMSRKLRKMQFHAYPIDFWMDRLPSYSATLSDEEIEFLLSENVWDFLVVCWTKYRSGAMFSFSQATDIRTSLHRVLFLRKQNKRRL